MERGSAKCECLMATSSLPGINTPTAEQWPAPVAVWEHTGQSGQFRVRLDLIRGTGRAGAIPDFTLAYQTGNQNGIFGLGWSLNIPSFSRGDGRNLPRYRDAGPSADKFSSTEFGEIVPVSRDFQDNGCRTCAGSIISKSQDFVHASIHRSFVSSGGSIPPQARTTG